MIVAMAALPWECAALRQQLEHVSRWRLGARIRAWIGEAGKSSVGVIQTGIGLVRAEHAAESALRDGSVEVVLAFGCAGGLVPELSAGALVVPECVVDAATGTTTVASAAVRASLLRAAERASLPTHHGALLTAPRPLTTPAEKAQAALSFAAVAVDMESAAIAAVAERRRVPFACVRSILDPVDCTLPAESLIDPSRGRPRPTALLRYLWTRPQAISELRQLNEHKLRSERALDQFFSHWVQELKEPGRRNRTSMVTDSRRQN
jgi:nucleoside phosphorylase